MVRAISKNYHFVGKSTNSTGRLAALQGSCKHKTAVKFVQLNDPLKIHYPELYLNAGETKGACSMHRRDEN